MTTPTTLPLAWRCSSVRPLTRAPALRTLRFVPGRASRRDSLRAAALRVAEEAITHTRECLTVFAARHPGATFVLETGTHSPWVSRLLE